MELTNLSNDALNAEIARMEALIQRKKEKRQKKIDAVKRKQAEGKLPQYELVSVPHHYRCFTCGNVRTVIDKVHAIYYIQYTYQEKQSTVKTCPHCYEHLQGLSKEQLIELYLANIEDLFPDGGIE